jgi:hypothetical protein
VGCTSLVPALDVRAEPLQVGDERDDFAVGFDRVRRFA